MRKEAHYGYFSDKEVNPCAVPSFELGDSVQHVPHKVSALAKGLHLSLKQKNKLTGRTRSVGSWVKLSGKSFDEADLEFEFFKFIHLEGYDSKVFSDW